MILKIAGSLALIMVAVRILIWQWKPNTRPCYWFGHDKRYVAVKTTGCVDLTDPRSNKKPFTCGHGHKIGDENIYVARWVCRRCPVMKEDCLGTGQDWTIEHEKLVPDVKKWTNWSQSK
jgi:hypothetical protein